jgi:hypothetical protein
VNARSASKRYVKDGVGALLKAARSRLRFATGDLAMLLSALIIFAIGALGGLTLAGMYVLAGKACPLGAAYHIVKSGVCCASQQKYGADEPAGLNLP